MGDRVAVMRKGVLQQVDEPQTLYEHPENLFVAGFIGSPAMNLLEANLRARRRWARGVELGGFTAPDSRRGARSPSGAPGRTRAARSCSACVPRTWRTRRWCPTRRRPSHLGGRRARRGARLRRRSCTSRSTHAPALTDDVKELALDVGVELSKVEEHAARGHTNVIARLNPRTRARKGEPIELVVDTNRLHFFDVDTALRASTDDNDQLE